MRALSCLLVAVSFLSACAKQAESSVHAGTEFKVDKLFTVDGCTVYRFEDIGSHRYFTNCNGGVSWSEQHGKTRVPVAIPTNAQ